MREGECPREVGIENIKRMELEEERKKLNKSKYVTEAKKIARKKERIYDAKDLNASRDGLRTK